jgi:hypothetical protein
LNKSVLLALAATLLWGCASYDGRGLQPGKSTAAEVEALMGPSAERRATADGGSVAYFTRGPLGRHTYAATYGPDGVLRSLEQVLTYENAGKLVPGTTTRRQVRELLGPPGEVSRFPRQQREVWEYKWLYYDDKRVLWVQFSDDGIVREAINMHDYESDPASGRRRR